MWDESDLIFMTSKCALSQQSCREIQELQLFTASCKLLLSPAGSVCRNWDFRSHWLVLTFTGQLYLCSQMQKPWSVVQFLSRLRTFHFLEGVLKQQCRMEQRLVGAVTWAAVSKPSLTLAFERRSPFLLHFLCLVFIFRPAENQHPHCWFLSSY